VSGPGNAGRKMPAKEARYVHVVPRDDHPCQPRWPPAPKEVFMKRKASRGLTSIGHSFLNSTFEPSGSTMWFVSLWDLTVENISLPKSSSQKFGFIVSRADAACALDHTTDRHSACCEEVQLFDSLHDSLTYLSRSCASTVLRALGLCLPRSFWVWRWLGRASHSFTTHNTQATASPSPT
jgi:hypothetical protein